MKYSTIAATLAIAASGALAQNTTQAQNPYIPSGISAGCSSFMSKLNSDSQLATCSSALVSATKAFQSSSSSNASASSALSTLCSVSTCDDAHTRSLLSQFYTQCQSDMASNDAVKSAYDVLYFFAPFRSAICAKDDTTGNTCTSVLNVFGGASSAKRSVVARAAAVPTVDASTLKSSGLPFLFLTTSTASEKLCTPCAKNILKSYVSYESKLPYGTGISQSPILGGQTDLFSHVKDVCGADFLSTITSDAGAAPLAALGHNGASSVAKTSTAAVLIGAAGLAALLM